MTTTVLMGISHDMDAQEVVNGIIKELNSTNRCIKLVKKKLDWHLHFSSADAEYQFKWRFDTRLSK